MAIFEGLERAEGFTETETQVARFVLAHADEVTRLSIADLAAATFSSNATIIRICRKLGASGYRDFRVQLAAELERRRLQRDAVDVDRPFSAGEDATSIASGIAAVMKEAVDSCYAAVPAPQLDRAARLVRSAAHTYIFAAGDSRISAMAFANMLIKLGIHAVIADEYGDGLANASAAMPGDAALVISYSGKLAERSDMQRILPLLKERRCRAIWLSAAEAPLGFDAALRIPAREADHGKIATFYSQTCIRYLLNCLYAAIYALDYEGNAARKALIDGVDLGDPTASA